MKSNNIRKLVFIFCLALGQTFAQKQTEKKVYTVSGTINQTFAYCGGARPSEEILQKLAEPKPYIGKTFYLRKGKTNTVKEKIILKFTVDSAGRFSFLLSPGIYSIIQAEQVKGLEMKMYRSTKDLHVDETCLKNWWKKPYFVLEIKDKNRSDLNFSFYHPCFVPGDIPCITYTGPMPP